MEQSRLNQAVGPAGIDKDTSYGKLLVQLVEIADKLTKETQDIRSVAIVVDYNMPEQAAMALPPGIWLAKDQPSVENATRVLYPISRMQQLMSASIINTIVEQQGMATAPGAQIEENK